MVTLRYSDCLRVGRVQVCFVYTLGQAYSQLDTKIEGTSNTRVLYTLSQNHEAKQYDTLQIQRNTLR